MKTFAVVSKIQILYVQEFCNVRSVALLYQNLSETYIDIDSSDVSINKLRLTGVHT